MDVKHFSDDEEELPLDTLLRGLPKNSSILGSDAFSQDVAYLLIGMGMEKHLEKFKEENISLNMLRSLTAQDLEAMGITDPADCTKILGVRTAADQYNMNVPPNSYEDLVIAKNLLNHTKLLSDNLQYVIARTKRARLTDHYLTREYSGASLVRIVTEKAVKQTLCINKALHDPEHGTGLIQKIIKKEKMELPKFLVAKLSGRRRVKRGVLLMLAATGICSLAVLIASAVTSYFPPKAVAFRSL